MIFFLIFLKECISTGSAAYLFLVEVYFLKISSTISFVISGKSAGIILSDCTHLLIFSSLDNFNFFNTGTFIFLIAAALHCCSYCPFIGIAISFFPRNNASEGVSKPAPHNTPADETILLIKPALFIGKMITFFSTYGFFECFEKTCHSTPLIWLSTFIIFLSL